MKKLFVYLIALSVLLPTAMVAANSTPQNPPKITRPTKSASKPAQKPTSKENPAPIPKKEKTRGTTLKGTEEYEKGDDYYYGRHGLPKNYKKAAEYYIIAANKGNADAQSSLGRCYYNGQGVSQNYYKAVEWYRKAAEQGDAMAQHNLGVCYYNGQGVSQNYYKAVEW
ncbi:MAG: tetratricopeptide repeat protein, partial [Bacteroidales bacterium]|nr:tetratricopeptide repeat protein [Bacteroidales bacterium]